MDITLQEIRGWVVRIPPESIIGRVDNYYYCPVAEFIKHNNLEITNVRVGVYGIYWHNKDYTKEFCIETPKNILNFIINIDSLKNTNAPLYKRDILPILDEILATGVL
jgi:hypothetical protein